MDVPRATRDEAPVGLSSRGASARIRPGSAAALLVAASAAAWAGSSHIGSAVGHRAAINLLQLTAALAAGCTAGARARHAEGRARAHLSLLSLAALSWSAGQIYWTTSELALARPVPFPSMADLGFVASYPLLVAALLVAPASRAHSRSRLRQTVDWLVVASSLLFLSWVLVLDRVFASLDATSAAGALSLAYPLADVALVAVAGSALASARSRWRRPLGFVATGLIGVAVADSGFSYLQSTGSYATGSIVDLGWVAGWLVVAIGASVVPLAERPPPLGSIEAPGRVSGLLPPGSLLAVAVTATVLHLTGQPFTGDPVLWWTGLTIFGLSAARAIAARAEGDAHARQLEAQGRAMADLLNRHSIAFDSAAMGTWYLDGATGMVSGSAELERLFRVPPGHFDVAVDQAAHLVLRDDVEAVLVAIAAALESDGEIDFEARARRGDGTTMWLHCQGRAVTDAAGEMVGIVGAITDVTERRELHEQLARRARQGVALAELGRRTLTASSVLETLDDAVATVVAVVDADLAEVLQLEPDRHRFRLLAGHGWARETIGKTTLPGVDTQAGFTLTATEPVIVEDLRAETRFTDHRPHAEQAVRSGMTTAISTAAGPWGILGVHRRREEPFSADDASFLRAVANTIGAAIDRTTSEVELRHLSLHDPLTDLPNRTLLADRLEVAMASARKSDRYVAVLHISLDRFTLVNSSLGVPAGDQALIEVARRLDRLCRPGDTAARLEGDQFVVTATVGDAQSAIELASRAHAAVAEPLVVGDPAQEIFLSASIGVVLANGSGDAASHLRDASIAADRASASGGRRYELFDDRFRDRAIQRVRVESELRHAIADGEIEPFFQPIVRVEDGSLAGVEALARWRHPERGLLCPAEFLEAADASGLTVALGEAILSQAARHAARWNRRPGTALRVSVNLASAQLTPELLDTIASTLATTGTPADRLCLEIVESALADEASRAVSLLAELRARWPIEVHIDDFGTGHSSLSRLASFPVSGIKIDRSFVADLGRDAAASAVVAAIVDLGHALGLEVTAEGVETREQLAILSDLGCDLAQGWLFARAMRASEIDRLVAGAPLPSPTTVLEG